MPLCGSCFGVGVGVLRNMDSEEPTTPAIDPSLVTVPASSTATEDSSTGAGSTGFFSLGESNVAERARQLKEEKLGQLHAKKEDHGTSSISDGARSDETGDRAGPEGEGGVHGQGDALHEFDGLLISHQVEERDNTLHKSLVEGFRTLRDSRDAKQDVLADDPSLERAKRSRQYCATVNFIDPTTKTASATSPSSAATAAKPTNMLQQQSMFQKQDSGVPPTFENAYEKLTYIFERDYSSTLRSVQYKNLRTGENDLISSLPVNPVLTRTGGGGGSSSSSSSATDKSFNTPWGGTASTAIVPVSDPSEWHTGPFCHVYIAACDSAEHYRTKVRPALQAFVSQIESAASNTTANQPGGHSADYLIAYIPTTNQRGGPGDPSTPDNGGGGTGRVGTAFFQKARQRFGGAGVAPSSSGGTNSTADDADDVASRTSLDSDEVAGGEDVEDPASTGSTSVALNFLSRTERALYRKIVADFPNGRVCVLSPASLDRSGEELPPNPEGVAIRTQEWNTFNRMLGTVIVNGFNDRCRRYKDELKRLDAQRAVAATAAKNQQQGGGTSSSTSNKPSPYAFNLGHFFLVKESLAFSFEQMQLPAEALLQYDEFRLYMPDFTDKDERKVRRARRKSKALAAGDESSPSLAHLADAGDFLGFRKKIRTEYDLTAVLDVMRRYLFAREISLLVRMEQPVELLSRCHGFVKVMYSIVLRGVAELGEEEQKERRARAAMWVVQFTWDVKCACDLYFQSRASEDGDKDASSVGTISSDLDSDQSNPGQADGVVASKLSELMEVSRLMLMQLGDSELTVPNPIRLLQKEIPDDLRRPWQTWAPSELASNGDDNSEKKIIKSSPSISKGSTERHLLLNDGSFSSAEDFEDTYLELCRAIVKTSRRAKRRRMAARLQGEIGEYHVRKGDLASAVPIFKAIVKMYRLDQWDRCHFWRLFRLAYCQRTTAQATDYLKTLVSCFSPRITTIAPTKALKTLQDDMEKVLEHPLVGSARYGKLTFLETSLKVINTTSEESTLRDGFDRKEVVKRFCSVGEKIQILASIKCWLPRSIELNSMKLFIVTYDEFASIIENSESVEEEDAAKVIALSSPVNIEPGVNEFTFEWCPSRAGQLILSTVELVWKQGYFYYDSMELPGPLLAIDVLPSEPTHTLTLEPDCLVPGHDQQVRMVFAAGSDIVTSAYLVLSCTEGISCMPPGEDRGAGKWMNECKIPLPACSPGEVVEIVAHVRCDLLENFANESISQVDSMDTARGLSTKVFTTYLHSEVENPSESDVPNMKNVLESFAPVLEETALQVASIQTVWLEPNTKLLLSVLVTCTTPYYFSIGKWSIDLPPPLTLVEGVDLNGDLLKRSVSDGDELSFAFECNVDQDRHSESGSRFEPGMKLKLLDDVGKIIPLQLALDLNELYADILAAPSPKMTITLLGTLTLEFSQGLAGNSVLMTYAFDIINFNSPDGRNGVFVYSISWDDCDWLVSGKVSGVMARSESHISCEVVGIPTIPGLLDRFPVLQLHYVDSDDDTTSVPVNIFQPEPFQSLGKVGIITVAHSNP